LEFQSSLIGIKITINNNSLIRSLRMFNTLKKISTLLTNSQKRDLFFLAVLLLIGVFFEILSLGFIFPFLNFILNPSLVPENSLTQILLNYIDFSNVETTILYGLIFLVFIFFIKSLILIWISYKQNRFISFFVSKISNKLYSLYMNLPYKYHLNNNSTSMTNNIQVEVKLFKSYCMSIITITVEGALLVSILFTVIYFEPINGLISIAILSFFAILFFNSIKRKIKTWGDLRQKLDNLLSKNVIEGLAGIKEILVFNKSSFFTVLNKSLNNSKATIETKNQTLANIPRYFLEFISILGLSFFILLMVKRGVAIEQIISTLGLFVAAVFRSIPSINRVISSLQSMKYYSSSIDLLYNEFNLISELAHSDLANNKVFPNGDLVIENLSFKYENTTNFILDNISFNIQQGDTVGIVGRSGAGKSTLVDLMVGLHQPSNGNILSNGNDIQNNLQSWRDNIGYVPQSVFLIDDTIASNIAFGVLKNQIDYDRINFALESSQLKSFVDLLDNGISTSVGERGVQLSGGQRQRIGIARALYKKSNFLILDEATASLDTQTEKGFMSSIKALKGKMTILIITHKTENLKHCNDVYNIEEGNITKL
jgi:ATP-binding cassette, subfamily B, bacterial PglK